MEEQTNNNEKQSRMITFRCPERIYNFLQQQKYIQCKTNSAIIKEAIADWVYWQEELNKLKLERNNRTANGMSFAKLQP